MYVYVSDFKGLLLREQDIEDLRITPQLPTTL